MNDTFLNSANAPYVAELYSKFRNDPESVDTTWKDFFNNLNEDDYSVLKDFGRTRMERTSIKYNR